jgi:hypothetical protein
MIYPDDSQRITIVGRTGTGKTVAALHQLSVRSYTEIPWYIIDFKTDVWINRIPYAVDVDLDADIVDQPGIYRVHPIPEEDDKSVASLMRRIWQRQNCGVFIDEAAMIPRTNTAYNALLTQGRSRRCPVITVTQRPVGISKWAFTEMDFFQVFRLLSEQDIDKCEEYLPRGVDLGENSLPKYYSYYYDVSAGRLSVLKPAPKPEEILEHFDDRLKPQVQMHDEVSPLVRRTKILRKI